MWLDNLLIADNLTYKINYKLFFEIIVSLAQEHSEEDKKKQ